jgi:hypothetical protein
MIKYGLLFTAFILMSCVPASNVWFVEGAYRIKIDVDSGNAVRFEKPIECDLDFAEIKKNQPDIDLQPVTLIEVNKRGKLVRHLEHVQFDVPLASDTTLANLTFLLPGETPANTTRYFQLYLGGKVEPPSEVKALVSFQHDVEHEDQNSFKISTPMATYYYHTLGAGFASIDDRDGNDWLSYNPGVGQASQSGSGGMYRGLPNSGYPEGYNHPGKEVSNSWIVENGPLKVSIFSESNDQKMQCQWDIFPTYARLTYIKLRPPYWFLYEGTPGGELQEEADFCVRPGNIKTLCSEAWNGDIDAQGEPGEWLYFSDAATNRSIFLVQNVDDENPDSYWPMNSEMTVFGFGRLGMEKSIVRQQNQFIIGLAETYDYDKMKKIIDSAYLPINVKVGNIEPKP